MRRKPVISDRSILDDYIQDSAKIGSWSWTIDSEDLEWSKGTFDIFGVPYDKPIHDIMPLEHFPPEDWATLEQARDLCVKEFKPYRLKLRFTDAHGTAKWVEAYGEPHFEDDKLTKLVGTFQDITEAENRQRELDFVIRGTGVGVWRFNMQTDELQWDDNMYTLYEISKENFSGAFDAWESSLHPDYKDQAIADLNDALTGEREFDTTFAIMTEAGTVKHIHAKASVERDSEGNATLITGINFDVTEQKKMERAFVQGQKMEAMGTLSGGIAHDFNNLLAPILGYANLLARRLPADSKEQTYVGRIEEAAIRAKDLVRKILAISRDTVDRIEPVFMTNLVREVVGVLSASVPKDVRIHADLDENLAPIIGDGSGIYQLVLNLCTNGIQAMGESGDLTIVLKHSQEAFGVAPENLAPAGYAMLSISDTGCGMDVETQSHIFDPFYTTKSKGEERGTGLGLSMVAGILEAHNGTVHIESTPGAGSTFAVYLPITERRKHHETASADNAQPHLTGHVLLIDDEQAVLELGDTVLSEMGCKVSAFQSGEAAMQAFEQSPADYDWVITDYEMPEIKGREIAARIKRIRPEVPVIIMTGYSHLASDPRQFACDRVLPKPYDSQTLATAMRDTRNQG